MSTATAEAPAPAASGGKKKLIIILVAVLVLVLGGGGAAFMLLKKSPDAEEGADEEGGDHAPAKGKAKAKAKDHGDAHGEAAPRARTYDPKHPPVFVPLDAFTVNLADKDAERYAQIGITLEIDDPKIGEELKLYMPAVRNNILMVLSARSSAQLLSRDGKDKLARAILHAAVRPLGFPAPEDDEEEEDEAAADPTKKKKKRRVQPMSYPVTAVHFSTFIVQ